MVSDRQVQAFAPALITWQRAHGRHGLPWQGGTDPYRVWLSEVMLQQTQVSTVLSYFDRFLQRFPTVQALAQASLDEVLSLWSGLGYYSRARHLHRCAQAVCERHAGRFPSSSEALATLPGIGPSTAAAIAAFCFGDRRGAERGVCGPRRRPPGAISQCTVDCCDRRALGSAMAQVGFGIVCRLPRADSLPPGPCSGSAAR